MSDNLPDMADAKIISLTGPSGSGKTTIAQQLLADYPQLTMIPSFTSRARRPTDGPNDFVYISEAEFLRRKAAGELLWDVEVHATRYGTARAEIEQALARPDPSIIILVPEIVAFLCQHYPLQFLPIFIEPALLSILQDRMAARGDTAETIARRLHDCRQWAEEAHVSGLPYHFIRNDGPLEQAVHQVAELVGLVN